MCMYLKIKKRKAFYAVLMLVNKFQQQQNLSHNDKRHSQTTFVNYVCLLKQMKYDKSQAKKIS